MTQQGKSSRKVSYCYFSTLTFTFLLFCWVLIVPAEISVWKIGKEKKKSAFLFSVLLSFPLTLFLFLFLGLGLIQVASADCRACSPSSGQQSGE
jgi:hypothetical protein